MEAGSYIAPSLLFFGLFPAVVLERHLLNFPLHLLTLPEVFTTL